MIASPQDGILITILSMRSYISIGPANDPSPSLPVAATSRRASLHVAVPTPSSSAEPASEVNVRPSGGSALHDVSFQIVANSGSPPPYNPDWDAHNQTVFEDPEQ